MKFLKWPLKYVIPGLIAEAAVFLLLFCLLDEERAYREAADAVVSSGIAYLESLEAGDPTAVQKALNAKHLAMEHEELIEEWAQIESGEINIWSCFDDIIILGDSRADDFQYDGFLPSSRIMADMGADCSKADIYLDDVEAFSPSALIFTYGLNDVDGTYSTAEDFINTYTYILNEFRERVPDTEIYVCTIIAVNDYAQEHSKNFHKLPAFNEAIREMCTDQNYVCIECEDLLEDYPELYDSDGQHFYSDVYPIWAKRMIRSIYEYRIEQTAADAANTESSI